MERVPEFVKWLSMHRSQITGYLVACGGVALMSLVIGALLTFMHIPNISILYLFVVLVVASIYGRGPAIVASVLAFLTFDWFFTRPVHTLNVTDLAEWLALLTFLTTALITGQLAATVRARAEEAQRRAQENRILYELSSSISAAVRPDEILPLIVRRIVEVFGVRMCSILVPNEDGKLVEVAYAGERHSSTDKPVLPDAEQALKQRTIIRIDEWGLHAHPDNWFSLPGVFYVPLLAGEQVVGVLALTGIPPDQRKNQHLLLTFINQTALTIERIRLERESTRAEILARTDELRTALLNSVSHDLRTPLAAILAAATSLLQPDIEWDAATRHELLLTIREETERLNRLVGNLLDMSRIEAGSLRPEKDWYSVPELIAGVLDRLEPILETHPLKVDVPDDLPLACFDYSQISQVVTNLLENAAKYSSTDSSIAIRAWSTGDDIRISIRDQGPGIPPAEQARVFDKFYRAQSQGCRVSGSGLGLAIARGLVEAHGGQLWVQSTPGKGSTFIFTLPASLVSHRSLHPQERED